MQLPKLFRMVAATASAVAAGVVAMVTGGGESNPVELAVGDRAPEFSLPGSDGRMYRLSELLKRGRPVVVAWFPKAFTGG